MTKFVTGSMCMSPYSIPDRKKKFEEEFYQVLYEREISESDACIVMYRVHKVGMFDNSIMFKELFKIYKTIEDFKSNFDRDCENLPDNDGYNLVTWIFD